MNEIKIFNYEKNEVRTVEKDGEIWWVLADVCKILEYTNPTMILERLDEDEKAKLDLGLSGGATNVINEFGLHSLILRSQQDHWQNFFINLSIGKIGCTQTLKKKGKDTDLILIDYGLL